jgi:preprotein translocase SecE subunit
VGLAEDIGCEGWLNLNNEITAEKPLLKRISRFIEETVLEVKRSTWPDRRTLVMHTVIVIAGVFALGIYVFLSDEIVARFLRLLVPKG